MFLVDFELPATPQKNPRSELHSPKQNHILAALPSKVFERLLPNLKLVPLKPGLVLYEAGSLLRYIYFPVDSIVSLLDVMENGSSAGIAMIGNEGMVGISLSMGGKSTPSRAVVQSAGYAYRLDANALDLEFEFGSPLQHTLLHYTHALITMMMQTVVCKRHHSVDQQLCRWLLSSLDRLPSNDLHMTLELITNMLGAHREVVTEAVGKLQAAGLINYSRGHITVLDRPKLEARVCKCYVVVKKEFDRVLSAKTPN